MRAIITGGTGLIGSRLAASLAQAGHEVVVLSRNPGKHALPQGVRAEKWDARTAAGWGHLADGAGAIINLAGENISGTGMRCRRAGRPNASGASPKAVCTPARRSWRPYGRRPTSRRSFTRLPVQITMAGGIELFTENDAAGDTFLGSVAIDSWEPATAAVEAMGVRRVIGRQGPVMSMDGGPLPFSVFQFKLFVGGRLGSGNQWMSWVHIEDAVRAIQYLIENKQAQGVYNIAAPNPVTNKEFTQVLGQVMGRPTLIPAPAFALKLALGEISALVLEGQRIDVQKLRELGFTFNYPDLRLALLDLLKR
jgi:uncharacterized protein